MIPNKCTIKDYKALLREANEEIEAREKRIRYLENKNQKLSEENSKLKGLLNKAFMYVHQDFIKNLRVGFTPLSSFLIRDIIEALKDFRRKNATEFIYVEDNKDEVLK